MPKYKKPKKQTVKLDGTPKKSGRPASGRTIKVPAKFQGHEPRVEFHPGAIKLEDTETDLSDKELAHQYPPPKRHKIFRETWMRFIDSIIRRDNFMLGHLSALGTLCDLMAESHDLSKWIEIHGRSYASVGRQGEVWKLYPEVGLKNKIDSQISTYMKLLGVAPKKDFGPGQGAGDGQKGEWE